DRRVADAGEVRTVLVPEAPRDEGGRRGRETGSLCADAAGDALRALLGPRAGRSPPVLGSVHAVLERAGVRPALRLGDGRGDPPQALRGERVQRARPPPPLQGSAWFRARAHG